jgi:mono/diheme cytochrome c family protein
MRHIAVRRVALLLGVLFACWAMLFAWLAQPGSTAEPPAAAAGGSTAGQALFERHCASCHAVQDLRATAGSERDSPRRAELEQFLADHGDASATEDDAILDYLFIGR